MWLINEVVGEEQDIDEFHWHPWNLMGSCIDWTVVLGTRVVESGTKHTEK